MALKKDLTPLRGEKSAPKTKEELAKIRSEMMKKRPTITGKVEILKNNDSGFINIIDDSTTNKNQSLEIKN